MAQDINAQMPTYVTGRIVDALNDREISVRRARILVVGVTYKPDVGDIRESAAIEVLARLARKGSTVSYHDPFVGRITEHGLDLHSVPLDPARLANVDCVALLTPHSSIDLRELTTHSSFIFDARNAIGRRDCQSIAAL
jgi:UDP-N-acetyl-D-glucosamine dehydrogenase